MKRHLRHLCLVAAPVIAAAPLVSCYYDPYGYNPNGYPVGPALGVGAVTGSVFVATASSDWGYDPYRYCYYNYGRRAYYDPWLGGYYPVGYYPPAVVGCPHPYGWRPGHGVCPPPRGVNDRWIDRYNDRLASIQASNHAWASKVRYNRQTQIQHMQENNAAWANRVRANRQGMIEVQRDRNESIREAQQSWAERVRGNRGVNRAQGVVPSPQAQWNTNQQGGASGFGQPPARIRAYGPRGGVQQVEPLPQPNIQGNRRVVRSPLLTPVEAPAAVSEPAIRRGGGGAALGRGRGIGGGAPAGGRVPSKVAPAEIRQTPPPPVAPPQGPPPAGRGKGARSHGPGNPGLGEGPA